MAVMKLLRRQFFHLVAGATALPALPRVASALDYPARPVHIIVGFAPASGTDIMARLIGQWLSGAARPAIRHREPTRSCQQYRHRDGRERAPGRIYAPCGNFRERGQ